MNTVEKLLPLLPKWERSPFPLLFTGVGYDDQQGTIRSQQNRYGTSREFAEHREYSHGDDHRYIDWKQYGRTDRFFVKKYHDESSSAAAILLDAHPSLFFRDGTSDSELSGTVSDHLSGTLPSKWEYGKWLAGLFLWRLLRDRQQVTVRLFGSEVSVETSEKSVHSWCAAAGSGIARWKTILNTLDSIQILSTVPPLSVWKAIEEYRNKSARQRLFVIITDGMFEDEDNIVRQCHLLAAQRHHLCFLHLLTPDEVEFPYHRTYQFEDMAGTQKLVLDAAQITVAYKKRLADFLRRLQTGLNGTRMWYRFLRTDVPLEDF